MDIELIESEEISVPMDRDLAIAWTGLKYSVDIGFKGKRKTILDNIDGSLYLGQFTAVLGPSGAGKTTLLKCITGRQVNGIDKNTKFCVNQDIEIKSCLIVQEVREHLLNGLTALESLIYSSKLKNRKNGFDHELNARNLLKSFNIKNTANTCVDKCSGGEQKRIAIALELTAQKKPNLLCIDEATSGLDSCAAQEIIRCLKTLTEKDGISVVTSIHQPNNEIISEFDKLYVMSIRGQCVFEGPPQKLMDFVQDQTEWKANHNLTEIIMKIFSNNEVIGKTLLALRKTTRSFQSPFTVKDRNAKRLVLHNKSYSLYDTWHLMSRSLTCTLRHRFWNGIIQFLWLVVLAFIFTMLFDKETGKPSGCFYYVDLFVLCDQSEDTVRQVKLLSENNRLIFFALIAIQFFTLVTTALVFTQEICVFYREHSNGWYSTGSFFVSKILVELPMCLITSFCYAIIIYKSNNQMDDSFRLWGYVGVMVTCALTAQGWGFLIGIIAESNEKLANIGSVGVFLINLLLSGFFAPVDELPDNMSWITYISSTEMCFKMQMYLIYGFDRCDIGQESGVLMKLGMEKSDGFWLDLYTVIAQILLLRGLAFVVLLFKANKIKILNLYR